MMFRQGDVLIVRVEAAPDLSAASEIDMSASITNVEIREQIQQVVALGYAVVGVGEASGHMHIVRPRSDVDAVGKAIRFLEHNGKRYLDCPEDVEIVHDEHYPIALSAGVYELPPQREWQPQGSRLVID